MRRQRQIRSVAGQALIEFLVIFWFAFSLLMLIIQITLMFNAHSVLKLAAYNAARAAIVARDKDPEKPVKLKDMQDAAKLAAFLTIVPVIPGMHARINSFSDVVGLVTSMPADLGSALSLSGAQAAVGGYGHGVVALAVEFFGKDMSFSEGLLDNFSVKFVRPSGDPNPPGAQIKNLPQDIEFDDTSKTNLSDPHGNNLIKVVVEWRYPLVIPLADQAIYAYTHTMDVLMGYVIGGKTGQAMEVALGLYKRRPVWEVGWIFREGAFSFTSIFGFRVPLRQSYVMRMQWDRAKGKL